MKTRKNSTRPARATVPMSTLPPMPEKPMEYKKGGRVPKLGSGKRFATIEAKARKYGATNPAAVAASVGIKKYGVKKMTQMAQAGKRRAKKRGK